MDIQTLLADAPESLSVRQVAALLKVHRRTVSNYLLRPNDPLPGYRMFPGSPWRIDREELRGWLQARHNVT